MDVVSGTVVWNGEWGEATFTSLSSSLCPASCPGACCCSAALCCVPFEDDGKNKLHLDQLKEALDKVNENCLARSSSLGLLLRALPFLSCFMRGNGVWGQAGIRVEDFEAGGAPALAETMER